MKNFKQLKLIMLYVAFVPSAVNADPLTYEIEGKTVTVINKKKIFLVLVFGFSLSN